MATVASINVGLNAYTNQFDAAIAKSSANIKKFKEDTERAGSVNFGTQLQGATFAVQDFVAVLGNGGQGSIGRALAAASNNVLMMASAVPHPYAKAALAVTGLAMQFAPLIENAMGFGNELDNIREKMDATFNRDLKITIGANQLDRQLGKMDSKGAMELSEGFAARAADLRTELDATRKRFQDEVTGMIADGRIVDRSIGGNANPILKGQGKNGINLDFNYMEFTASSEATAKRIESQRDKLADLDFELNKVKGSMDQATKAGRWQEMQEGVQKSLDAWNEFNDAIKNHEELLARQKTNQRLDMQGRVFNRLQSETGTTRAGTGAAGFGTSEAYSAIAAATRVNGKQDIQTLIEIEKRKEAEDKKLRKAVEDGFAKSAATIVSMN